MRGTLRPLAAALCAVPHAAALPRWSWGTVQRFAHCSNKSGLLRPDVAAYFATLPAVTFEKWQGQFAKPLDDAAETKIEAVGAQIKAINASTEVLMYYQTDWARTWYTSGRWFDQHPDLEVHDAGGELIKGGGETPLHNWHLYDYAKPEARQKYVDFLTAEIQSPHLDGVFIDGFRDGHYSVVASATPDEQAAWVAGLNETVHMLRAAVGPDATIMNNGASEPNAAASGLMLEFWDAKKDPAAAARALGSHAGSVVQAHCQSCGNDADFALSLAAFLVGMDEGAYLGWGGWTDCASYLENDKYDEFRYPLGRPSGPAQVAGDTYTRDFATGTKVVLTAATPPQSCIHWSNGKHTGNAC